MFITEREIEAQTGFALSRHSVNLAQMMVESFIGKVEEDIENASDRALLAQAVTFQAIYMEDQPKDVLVQAAVLLSSQGGNQTQFDGKMFAPFLSPFAVKACQQLSWKKTRSVKTGKVMQSPPKFDSYYRWTHDIGVV